MGETEHITVANVSESDGDGSGAPVSLPVVELLTGRGFITGKSGSGKSNSASVVAEKLLDNGFGLLIVDIDGEYYGLKEEYEILHAGDDEECDIRITEAHAEKLATLALERNVPIILDVSSFLDESEAAAVLTAVAKHLFAKAKKHKQPFLVLVEEVHEYIPEGGSVGECGKMLIKIGKRGRKHGLGIVGISQRPADVKKDFITQCDWLVWHRLTWNNDTKVVSRILDSEFASAVEDLDDGEAFLMTDWAETVQRVQFERKQTFDAGATPGLDDFERPELKSVSDGLVSELAEINDEQQARDDRIAELREELDQKNSRIAELEAELQDARDLRRMADQFVDALVDHVDGQNPGRTEKERLRDRRRSNGATTDDGAAIGKDTPTDDGVSIGGEATTDEKSATEETTEPPAPEPNGDGGTESAPKSDSAVTGSEFSAEALLDRLNAVADAPIREGASASDETTVADGEATPTATVEAVGANGAGAASARAESGGGFDDGLDADSAGGRPDAADERSGATGEWSDGEEPLVVRELKADIGGLATRARRMLSFYRDHGPETPVNAHVAAGGDDDRTLAYAHNRALRTRGLVEHVGRGRYDYRLRSLLDEAFDGRLDEEAIDEYADRVERVALETDSEE